MFQSDQLYLTSDPALLILGPYSTLAHWRHEGRGPAYFKFGSKVAYRGERLERLDRIAARRDARSTRRRCVGEPGEKR